MRRCLSLVALTAAITISTTVSIPGNAASLMDKLKSSLSDIGSNETASETIQPVSTSGETIGDLSPAALQELIRTEIRETLINDPQIVIDSIKAYQQLEQDRQNEAANKIFQEVKDNAKGLPTAGNPKSDVTVIEFFDYNCGACRMMAGTIKESLDLNWIFIDFPILSPGSTLAAKASYAATQQDTFWEYHLALMESGRSIQTEDYLLEIAGNLGMDQDKFKKDMTSAKAQLYIDANMALAERLNLTGTPSMLINGNLIKSALPKDQFDEAVAEVRAEK